MPFWASPTTFWTSPNQTAATATATTADYSSWYNRMYQSATAAATTGLWTQQYASPTSAVNWQSPLTVVTTSNLWKERYQPVAWQDVFEAQAYEYDRHRVAAPGLITHQWQARLDEELYRRAVAEHDDQEAARMLRIVEQHARTAEERRQLLEAQAQRTQEEQQRRTAARERANQLLRENLTPQQLETFDRNGWFVVEGGRTKTKYRIRSGTVVANVDVIGKDNRTTHRLCGHVPVDRVPPGDQMLAQKIMIELAEDDFLRIANRHAA